MEILGPRELAWEAELGICSQLCQPRVIRNEESGEVGCPLVSSTSARASTELVGGWWGWGSVPSPSRTALLLLYCARARAETPASSAICAASPIAPLFSASLCRTWEGRSPGAGRSARVRQRTWGASPRGAGRGGARCPPQPVPTLATGAKMD